jgi:DNA helicase-4
MDSYTQAPLKKSKRKYRALLFILLAILTIGVFNLIKYYRRKTLDNRIAKEAELRSVITVELPLIQNANSSFPLSFDNYKPGYVSNYVIQQWRSNNGMLFERINHNEYKNIGLDSKDEISIDKFIYQFSNCDELRKKYNNEFIKNELTNYSSFFDNIEGRKLDLQQRTAIVTDEDNNLIIAGAGSGKTTTIVGKILYLSKRYNISPSQFLVISFTNKSSATLANRINLPGIDVKTFHKFGRDVILDVEKEQPSIFDTAQYKSLITAFFNELLQDSLYLKKVTEYFTNFLKPVKLQDEFKTHGDYIQYLKDQNFSTYKTISFETEARKTYKREIVKSIEECNIANFLLFNNINYEYELPYKHKTATKDHRQYKPDFTINPESNTIYLEHYGINKNGKVPHFFAKDNSKQSIDQATSTYKESIDWKRETHKKHNTALVETFSYEMFDDTLFTNLSERLSKVGVTLKPKSTEEIWKIISNAAKEEVDNFIVLFQTFITLMKSNGYSIERIIEINNEVKGKYDRERNFAFIELVRPIYEKYEQHLTERNEIDFSDMINKSIKYIASEKYKNKFSYVIIDEFQDLSLGRYQLVQAVKQTNPGCKIFCVGDDWQSIYRFAGSDMSLFNRFEKYFGHTEKSKIETTYRFHNPLIAVSSKFILRNPTQTSKELKSIAPNKSTTYKIVYSNSDNQEQSFALESIFNDLLKSNAAIRKEILILGRYSFDIKRIANARGFHVGIDNETITYTPNINQKTQKMTAKFMTVHKSKGLEADIVILINCDSGIHGFPSDISDDPVLNLVLSDADQFPNGEERRLFYVAITRARETVYLVVDRNNKSKFISELEGETEELESKRCPKCKNGDVLTKTGEKNGKKWAFFSCSNFKYGCEYHKWIS